MTELRRDKVLGVARDVPPQGFEAGGAGDRLAVVGWGSTYGPLSRAVDNLRKQGQAVAHLHLPHIWPLPANLRALLAGFEKILVPAMNGGPLVTLLRRAYLVPAQSIGQVPGTPSNR